MDRLIIKGPCQLSGDVNISKAKNAYLPILAACLLNKETIVLKDVPGLRDINTMIKLLETLGVTVDRSGKDFTINTNTLNSHEATYELVKTMRASIFVLGPLLGRLKKAKVSLPGGCAIGTRPIDLHLKNLEKMGAEISIESGYVEAKADNLTGCELTLDFPSVGATENLMMAGVFAKGQTIIHNSALEPEIDDLANFLNSMGAKVSGIGTKTLIVDGVEELHSTNYEAIGDRIEAITYIIAGLITDSEISVKGFNPNHIDFVLDTLKEMGAKLEIGDNFVKTYKSDLVATKIDTAPYPGFPTDAQAQIMALMTQVKGSSLITENIFENRFMHVPELTRLGASIDLKGKTAFIEGKNELTSAPVMCTDLRASAALVLAALSCKGETEIRRVYHLDRGYELINEKLKKLGVDVSRYNDGQ